MIKFILNDQKISTDVPHGTVMLDFVRYHKELKGTKIGCREGDCGACTILVGDLKDGKMEYKSVTSCLMPIGNAHGKHIVTIEGLNLEDLSPVQKAFIDQGGTQCGFCTVGFVVSLSGFCMSQKEVSCQNAVASMDGNICRCTGYKSIERAAEVVVKDLEEKDCSKPLNWLTEREFIPKYFASIHEDMDKLKSEIFHDKKEAEDFHYFVGGGTDVFVQKPELMAKSKLNLVFDHPELNFIEKRDSRIYIGGAATADDIQNSKTLQDVFPEIRRYFKLVSSTQIRNMGTVAGNMVNASPIGDLSIFFLSLGSTVVLSSGGVKREVPLKEFFKEYKVIDKAKEEHIEAVYFSVPSQNSHFNFEKVSKRTYLDIASVNSAIVLEEKDGIIQKAQLSAGGVGPVPTYLHKTSEFLIGKRVSSQFIVEANEIAQAEISPISDARGTTDYKRLLLRQLIYSHFLKFYPQTLKMEDLV